MINDRRPVVAVSESARTPPHRDARTNRQRPWVVGLSVVRIQKVAAVLAEHHIPGAAQRLRSVEIQPAVRRTRRVPQPRRRVQRQPVDHMRVRTVVRRQVQITVRRHSLQRTAGTGKHQPRAATSRVCATQQPTARQVP